MPSWKAHIVFNLVFMTLFVVFLNQAGIIENFLISLSLIFLSSLASVIPDLDSTKSKVRDRFSMVLAGIIVLFIAIKLSIESISTGVIGFIVLYLILRFLPMKHRGVTHTVKFGLAFSLVFSLLLLFAFGGSFLEFFLYFAFIFLGYLSHILLDMVG